MPRTIAIQVTSLINSFTHHDNLEVVLLDVVVAIEDVVELLDAQTDFASTISQTRRVRLGGGSPHIFVTQSLGYAGW